MVAFQPIMVMKCATAHDLGVIYEIISVLAVVPSLLVACLSKRMMDRRIFLTGMVLKAVGIPLFLPIFLPEDRGRVTVYPRRTGAVSQFILAIKGLLFERLHMSRAGTLCSVHRVHHF